MAHYGQITGTDQGVEGAWFVELNDNGLPIDDFAFIPVEAMPAVVPA